MKRGVSRSSVENFWSHCAEKFRGHPFNVSENLAYRKILCIIGGIKFSIENFLSHNAEKHRKGTLQCITNFRHQKMLRVNRKNIWHNGDSNPKPTASERCCPNLTAVTYFWRKRVGSFALKKKEKQPYWMNNFSCILHMLRKITGKELELARGGHPWKDWTVVLSSWRWTGLIK